MDTDILKMQDREVFEAIALETGRQMETLELIASENFTSRAVMQACGSVMTNKYAEGYPGKRYYGGCEFVDIAENLARDRAKKLFGCEYVNVQPHSGSSANMAVLFLCSNPVTASWVSTFPMAATSRTAVRSIFPGRCTRPMLTELMAKPV